jgi:hypothetical protein
MEGQMGRDKVALFAMIREDRRAGMGIRAIARRHGVHRRLSDIDARMEAAAARPVIIPDTIVADYADPPVMPTGSLKPVQHRVFQARMSA